MINLILRFVKLKRKDIHPEGHKVKASFRGCLEKSDRHPACQQRIGLCELFAMRGTEALEIKRLIIQFFGASIHLNSLQATELIDAFVGS